MSKKRVLAAMSGGVDSSVAAAILKNDGYEVIGATMKIWPKEHCGRSGKRPCCSLEDISDAKKVCDALGIRHYVFNFEKVFKEKVIDYFTREYLAGRTPNPCIMCNEKIKFGRLLKKAEELECDFISTGHYARIERNGRYRLRESVDKAKDQSYVLFSLSSAQMDKSLLPVGGINKDDVRARAKELGFEVHKKSDSQEICFVRDNNYADFIKEHCGIKTKKGDVVDLGGKTLGAHNGFWNFTIGQRRGLGIAHAKPLYVIDIMPGENKIIVGDVSEIRRKKFTVRDVSWCCEDGAASFEADVKIRYAHKKTTAVIKKLENKRAEVEFKESQEAITPGQAAVFYDSDYVLGGGWIEKVIR